MNDNIFSPEVQWQLLQHLEHLRAVDPDDEEDLEGQALAALHSFERARLIQFLGSLLADPTGEPYMRADAALGLLRLDPTVGMCYIRPLLADHNDNLVFWFCELLHGYGVPGNAPTIQTVLDLVRFADDPFIRIRAIQALETIGDDSVIPILCEVQFYDHAKSESGHIVSGIATHVIRSIQQRALNLGT